MIKICRKRTLPLFYSQRPNLSYGLSPHSERLLQGKEPLKASMNGRYLSPRTVPYSQYAEYMKWKNNTGPVFILHDGPPYSNGALHMGLPPLLLMCGTYTNGEHRACVE